MRQIRMRTLRTVSALLVLTSVGGCGDSVGTEPGHAAHWGDCTRAELDKAGGEHLATMTDGEDSTVVRLLGPGDGPCAGGLVGRTGAGVTGVDVSGLDLEPETAKVAVLSGQDAPQELLLVNGGSHPRGGFQPHVFVLYGGLHEVMVDGNPLLPFVATDGGGTPMTATCGPDGTVEVLRAITSEPAGAILAWDLERTTYRIEAHGDAVRTGTTQVRDHAADPVLRKEIPELFEPDGFFADCVKEN